MSKTDISPRNLEILRAIVDTHVKTAEPVGSRTLSRNPSIPFSPATIRNIMSDLAEAGYLTKPHASAGRLPTDLGYRLFVNNRMPTHEVTPEELRSIRQSYSNRVAQIEQVLTQASRILSGLTNQAGVILFPGEAQLQFRHIEFIRMGERKVLAVIISESGVAQNRIVQIEEDILQEELQRISRFLNEEFAGLSLRGVRARVLEKMDEEKHNLDALYQKAKEICRQAFLEVDEAAGEEAGFVLEGASRVYSQPDFADDFEKIQALFRAFEEKGKLVRLLDRCLDTSTVTVLIGAENEIEGMNDCSLVIRTYSMGDRPLGAIGVIGPKRMRYDRVVSLVEETANEVTRFISLGDRQ